MATVTFPDVGNKTVYLTRSKEYLYDVHDQLIGAEEYGAYGEGGTLTRAQQFVYQRGHCVVEFDDSGSGSVAFRLYGQGVDMPLAVEHVVPPVDPNPVVRHVIWTLTDQQRTVRDLACREGETFETWHVKYTAFGVLPACLQNVCRRGGRGQMEVVIGGNQREVTGSGRGAASVWR